jgi:hypothetical protein
MPNGKSFPMVIERGTIWGNFNIVKKGCFSGMDADADMVKA